MAADSQAALEEFMEQIPEEELEATLELEDYSTGSDISEAGQVYYLEDQDIEDDIPEDYEEDYEPSTPSRSCLTEDPHGRP